jgi:hypothetical protein
MKTITAITIVHNTTFLIKRCYESFRRFHPDMPLIIIDGSDHNDPCRAYVISLASDITQVGLADRNIGHGRGMHAAIQLVTTRFALIFDSDVEFIDSPVRQMLDMMEDDTYAVGYMEKSYYNGFEYGSQPANDQSKWMMMMHPFFHLLQVSEYWKFPPYVHHGAPCFKSSLAIHRAGLTDKILKQFPGLGHTSGQGFTWRSVPPVYIRHDTAGTRNENARRGKHEVPDPWEY